MEINGEVNIEIDQYADVSIEIDTDDLAETLCQDHNLVDDVVLHAYVDERMDDANIDYELRVQVDDLDTKVDELHEQVKGLISPEPDSDYSYVRTHVMDNYVRINDLREVIDAQIDLRVAGILNDVMKGIEEKRQENQ